MSTQVAAAVICLSGVLFGGGHAFALPNTTTQQMLDTSDKIIDMSDAVRNTFITLDKLNSIAKTCGANTNLDMEEQLFDACLGFYKLYGKHLAAVLSEGNTSITTITGMTLIE